MVKRRVPLIDCACEDVKCHLRKIERSMDRLEMCEDVKCRLLKVKRSIDRVVVRERV
jgi:hypothetical protein